VEKPASGTLAAARAPVAPKGTRPVHFRGVGTVRAPVFERTDIRQGDAIAGPAIIEQRDSTTVVPPGWRVTPDAPGHLIITRVHA
jgi:N-methylhydantoinase A